MQSFLQTQPTPPKRSNYNPNPTISSRVKSDFQLPPILKDDPNQHTDHMALRYHWLTIPKDYSSINSPDIQLEYIQLRKQLILLNEHAARNVERIAGKSIKRVRKLESNKIIEISGKEMDNNNAIIARLRAELEQLQKRVYTIEQTGKQSLDQCISQTKQQIIALRIKNKQLQKKSKEIGCSIQNGDQIFGEVHRLEVQVSISQKKRVKLQTKSREVDQNLSKVRRQMGNVIQQANSATNFIQQQLQYSRIQEAQRKIQSIYLQHTHTLQALRKNEQSWINIKQQKYHQYLKQLQQQQSKINNISTTIHNSQSKLIEQKEQLGQLQKKLKKIMQISKEMNHNNNIMITIIPQKQNENEDMVGKKGLGLGKKIEEKKKGDDIQSVKKSQELNNKIKMLNLRLDKSNKTNKITNKIENDRMNFTNTSSAMDTRQEKSKDGRKSDQSNISYQKKSIKPNPNRFDTINFTQGDNKITKVIERKSQKIEINSCSFYSDIQEHIQQNLPKSPTQPLPQHPSMSISEDISKQSNNISYQPIQISIPKSHIQNEKTPQKIQQKHHKEDMIKQNYTQPEQDEDIVNFRKSIQAELANPNPDLTTIDIALDQIENTIRRQESKNRIQRYTEDMAIQQQEESTGK